VREGDGGRERERQAGREGERERRREGERERGSMRKQHFNQMSSRKRLTIRKDGQKEPSASALIFGSSTV